jgi:very-short-patch-repair endonuclease
MLKDISPAPTIGTLGKARQLRKSLTLPEGLLWRELKKRPSGIKFRRQHPTGPFILDFFCSDARMAIEVDGEAHSRGLNPARDAVRDQWLVRAGVATLRIPVREVLSNLDGVVTHIVEQAKARLPLHRPSGGHPPRGKLGEE